MDFIPYWLFVKQKTGAHFRTPLLLFWWTRRESFLDFAELFYPFLRTAPQNPSVTAPKQLTGLFCSLRSTP